MLSIWFTLFYLLDHTQAQESDSTSNTLEGWHFENTTRSSWDILWTCLTTIFVCTWVSLHLSLFVYLSKPARTWLKLAGWLQTLICPEFFVIYAATDFYSARDIAARCNKAFRVNLKEVESEGTGTSLRNSLASEEKSLGREDFREWTTTQGFCITMNGFELRTQDGWSYTINAQNILPLIEAGVVQPGDLNTEDINNRAKPDTVARVLATLQGIWVLINILARAGLHLPISPLELSTVAYVLCSLFLYTLWWYKPKDMETPIILNIPYNRYSGHICSWAHSILDVQPLGWRHPAQTEIDTELEEAAPPRDHIFRRPRRILWTDVGGNRMVDQLSPLNEALATMCALIAFQGFSAIHMAGWNFIFPTVAERWAWRILSLIGLIMPWASFWIAMVPLLLSWFTTKFSLHVPGLQSYINPESRRRLLEGVAFEGALYVYYLSRVGIIILMFISLRALPAGSFIGIDWLSTIPHI